MAMVVDAAPLTVAVDLNGRNPSLAVTGTADHSNITSVVDLLERLAAEHEQCVSLDLGGLESADTGAIGKLACSAGAFRDRQKRLRLRNASAAVRSTLDRLSISDAFCVEHECSHDCRPDLCGIVSEAWAVDVFTLPASMAHCQEARIRVDSAAEAVGFSKCQRGDVALAVGEAVANAVEHGRAGSEESRFTVSCVATPERLCVSVSDTGAGFDPHDLPGVEESFLHERGRGIHCIRAVMDEVSFNFEVGTTVRMVKFGR